MARVFLHIVFAVTFGLTSGLVADVYAQVDASDQPMPGVSRRRDAEEDRSIKELMEKQRIAKDKKDHEVMLKRADDAARLSGEIATNFDKNRGLTPDDQERLDALEKEVLKIRKELGGDENDEASDEAAENLARVKPANAHEAVGYLDAATADLVSEIKKTSRFTISAAAIRSSNAVLRLVRFLRSEN
jgi:hypothetical protein